MPGEAKNAFNGSHSLHREGLSDNRHRLPGTLEAVEVCVLLLRLVDVDILLIGASEDREAEGRHPVVAHHDPGDSGLARPNPVEIRTGEMHEIAQPRHGVGPVRIVGQDWPAGFGACAGNNPVVGALRRQVLGDLT
jgi:hypothetical protein